MFVCPDIVVRPYIKIIREKCSEALLSSRLDFHIVANDEQGAR